MMYVKVWLDTCVWRALHGVDQSVSLKNVAKDTVLESKVEIQNTMGKHIDDFTEELSHLLNML